MLQTLMPHFHALNTDGTNSNKRIAISHIPITYYLISQLRQLLLPLLFFSVRPNLVWGHQGLESPTTENSPDRIRLLSQPASQLASQRASQPASLPASQLASQPTSSQISQQPAASSRGLPGWGHVPQASVQTLWLQPAASRGSVQTEDCKSICSWGQVHGLNCKSICSLDQAWKCQC